MFKFIIFSVFTSLARCYELLPGTDYFGGDLYPIYNVNSSLECLQYCESIRDCVIATWCVDICYVKSVKTSPSIKRECDTIDMYPSSESGSSDNTTITNSPANTTVTNSTQAPSSTPAATSSENVDHLDSGTSDNHGLVFPATFTGLLAYIIL